METPIYIALSRQMTLRQQMDVVANNIANANTPGYSRQRQVLAAEFPIATGGASIAEPSVAMRAANEPSAYTGTCALGAPSAASTNQRVAMPSSAGPTVLPTPLSW